MIFLDYDGTLVGYNEKPELAIPDDFLLKTLEQLLEFPSTELAIDSEYVPGTTIPIYFEWYGNIYTTELAP